MPQGTYRFPLVSHVPRGRQLSFLVRAEIFGRIRCDLGRIPNKGGVEPVMDDQIHRERAVKLRVNA
jgi:hypothetical protein